MNEHEIKLPETPTEQDYIIVYIDILGTKERLATNDISDVFENIYYPFLLAERIMPTIEEFGIKDIKIKIFSDNILFACPVADASNKNDIFIAYEKTVNILRLFLSMFLNEGILFRGAITVDKLLINDLMVWGKGLLTVVDLEENIAIYPRIILSEELLRIFDEFGLSGLQYEKKFSCLKDSDNCVFFNFFDYEDAEYMDSHLDLAKEHINKNIQQEQNGKNRAKILQKYYWFKNFLYDVERTYIAIQKDEGF